MKSRFYPYLDLLLITTLLAAGVYAYRHPDVARSYLSAVTLSVDRSAETATYRGSRPSHAPRAPTDAAPRAAADARVTAPARSWGTRIAAGHAFAKHGGEFGCSTREQFAAHIDRVIASPSSVSRNLLRGREAYFDDGSGTVVICDPTTSDGGTAFKPNNGRRYYDGLR